MKYPLYKRLASALSAYKNCIKTNNTEWADIHRLTIENSVKNELPHGSGIDGENRFDFEKSTPDKLIFYLEYHYMDENGFYAGWYDYTIIVTPSLANDYILNIRGKNAPNDAKEYLAEVFQFALSSGDE